MNENIILTLHRDYYFKLHPQYIEYLNLYNQISTISLKVWILTLLPIRFH